MSRLFYHTMQDNAGNLLFGVSGTMRLAGTGTLATIYGDEALTVILPNPMTNHPNYGSFKCFLPNGDFDFYMAKAGYTFETLTGVQGHGTMAQQDASAVAITGGTATLTSLGVTGVATLGYIEVGSDVLVYGRIGVGIAPDLAYSLKTYADAQIGGQLGVVGKATLAGAIDVGTDLTVFGKAGFGIAPDPAYSLKTYANAQIGGQLGVVGKTTLTGALDVGTDLLVYGKAGFGIAADPLYSLKTYADARVGEDLYVVGNAGIGTAPDGFTGLRVVFNRTVEKGLVLHGTNNDTGTEMVALLNNAGTTVGTITCSGTGTSYNTTSDARLKKMVEMFEGALDLVHQLRPVRFRWRADESEGQGFLANEVQQVIDGVVTGEPDAMNEDGSIRPQEIDHSKLVPLLTAAVKELSAQVQTLTVRVRELELLSVS